MSRFIILERLAICDLRNERRRRATARLESLCLEGRVHVHGPSGQDLPFLTESILTRHSEGLKRTLRLVQQDPLDVGAKRTSNALRRVERRPGRVGRGERYDYFARASTSSLARSASLRPPQTAVTRYLCLRCRWRTRESPPRRFANLVYEPLADYVSTCFKTVISALCTLIVANPSRRSSSSSLRLTSRRRRPRA